MSNTEVVAPRPPAHEPDHGAGGDSRRRAAILVGAAVALVLLIAAAYLLFFSGGGSQEEAGLVVVPAPAATPSPSAAPGKLPAKFEDNLGRNPFRLLAAEAPKPTPKASTTSPAPTTAPTAAPTAGSGATSGSYDVKVSDVNSTKKTATVTVDGVAYNKQTTGDLLPPGAQVQLLVSGFGSDAKGDYVNLTLGSAPPFKCYDGWVGQFAFSLS